MILLDTDHVSVLQWDGEAAERLRRRMADSTDDWLGITSITLEEQTKSIHAQVKYYALLSSLFRFLRIGGWLHSTKQQQACLMSFELKK